MKLTHSEGVNFFHIPGGEVSRLLDQNNSIAEKNFVDELHKAGKSLKDIKCEYYMSDFHENERDRRVEAIKSIHHTFFQQAPETNIRFIKRTDDTQSNNLFESVDIRFTNTDITVTEGYRIE